MNSQSIQIMIAMIIYMVAVIVIGIVFAKRANNSTDNYLLGGRSLGPWVTAMSAEASDMSGWLLMGLPGVAYWCGLADAAWTAIGLAIGTYLNWLLVSKRLRRYSIRVDNAITLPDFFSNRFREKKKIIMTLSALFILIFFTVYAASCFVTCGKLFSSLFNLPYRQMMILGAVFVLVYTLLGGFLAESASDFMQAIVMIVALASMVILCTVKAGGIGQVIENAKQIPGFLEFFHIASPTLGENGEQLVESGQAVFGEPGSYGFLSVISTLAWGLGYFGMPQVLLRFMAIRSEKELKPSRRIAMVWVIISLAVAVFIGIVGRQLFPTEHLTSSSSESIFITLSTSFLPPIVAGIVMAGILAATISSSDSYLLIAASAFGKNIFQGVFRKKASDKQVMWVTRLTLLAVVLIAILIALDENSVIFTIVSFAWAGFGATFGPLMLFSLFWKRINRPGAIAGMVGGAAMVFLWKLVIRPLGGVWGIYELLPAFLFSSLCIVVVSLLTAKPSAEIMADFDAVAHGETVPVKDLQETEIAVETEQETQA
ncbi:MAG: sodium/proline symporter PutP [Christensenellales bacterium]